MNVSDAVELLKRGGVVAYPTETAYALGCDATNKEAVKKLFKLKQRPTGKKVPVVVDSVKTIEKYAKVSPLDRYLSLHLHPGPLNLTTESGFEWIGAWRISGESIATEIARKLGRPVVATSANPSGKPPAFTPEQVKKYFDVPVVGNKTLKEGEMSTVFDSRSGTVIRKGRINGKELTAYTVAFKALQKVKPDSSLEKKVREVANEALEIAQKHHKDVIIGGSVAKGTFTRDVKDIDLFFLFSPGEELDTEVLKKVADDLGEWEMSYAQHPYVKARFRGFTVELVPAYRTEKVMSAADRSVWHVRWAENLKDEEKDEARLIKAFFKGTGLYGADLKVQGFSGYACEVLASRFGSLVNVLKNAEKVKRMSDPTDRKRNILASVSDENLKKFREAASAFLSDPSLKFFFPNDPPILPELFGTEETVLVVLKKPEMFEDAVWGMVKRYARKVEKNAKRYGYHIKKSRVWVSDRCFVAFQLEGTTRKKILVEGPPVSRKINAEQFSRKHRAFQVGNRLFAVVENKFPRFSQLALHLTGDLDPEGVFCGKKLEEFYRKMKEGDKKEMSDFLLGKKRWEY